VDLTRSRGAVSSASRWIPATLFILLSIAVFAKTLKCLDEVDNWAHQATYTRVDYWIASSECTLKTGAILAHCAPDGTVAPIEGINVADDRGHNLLSNLYALTAGRAIDRRTLTAANLLLNASGLFLVALALYCLQWKLAALLVLLQGRKAALPGPVPGADASAAHIAAFLFALFAVLLIVYLPLGPDRTSRRRFWMLLLLAAIGLAWATLLRQPYGIGGFMVASLVLALRVFKRRDASREARLHMGRAAVAATLIVTAVFFSTHVLVAARSLLYGIPRAELILQHGISHNLYLGLGVPGNPWGITWSDEVGHKAATTVGQAPYASEEHFANLRYLYFKIVLAEPLAVLAIYRAKLQDAMLAVNDDERRLFRAMALFLLLAVPMLLVHRRTSEETLVVVAVWAMFLTVILQGVLALPVKAFISPGEIAAKCGFAVLLGAYARTAMRWIKARF
jgi:hypothetical protein